MKFSSLFILIILSFQNLIAQSIAPSIINASGGSHTISGNTYDWSIGEMLLVNTFSTSGGIVTQGLLQPQELTAVAINNALNEINVYPNPVYDMLYIQSGIKQETKLSYEIFDMSARKIMNSSILISGTEKFSIDFSKFQPGPYLLNISVIENGTESHASYKIQKLK